MGPFTEHTDTSVEALEAKFERIRRDGYVFADEDLNNGVAVVSAPVFGPQGTVVCTLSVGGAASRFDEDRRRDIVDGVRDACAAFTDLLGGTTPRHD